MALHLVAWARGGLVAGRLGRDGGVGYACWASVLRAVLRARGAAGATEMEKVGFSGDFGGKIFGLGFGGGCAREVMVLRGVCGEH